MADLKKIVFLKYIMASHAFHDSPGQDRVAVLRLHTPRVSHVEWVSDNGSPPILCEPRVGSLLSVLGAGLAETQT